ncbi:uncharacterized protein LOC116170211 [Photinus pyralis]|uniref:Uncharacterized protein n=1 Tax=Photinus pyralis TaxID=7054 RepID=A0A1Y1K4Z1_PHOPY|nr:uncharacterized protein LOC116170211 [Photinus pyralis]
MRYCVFLALTVTVALGQKPNYLAGNVGQPDLAYRFRTNETTTVQTLGFRLGDEEGGTTRKIPVDARGDPTLVDRLNTWPDKNKPFWLLNYEKIEATRNQQPQQGTNQMTNNQPVNTQDRFGSASNSVRPSNQTPDQRGFNPSYDYDDFGNRKN